MDVLLNTECGVAEEKSKSAIANNLFRDFPVRWLSRATDIYQLLFKDEPRTLEI